MRWIFSKCKNTAILLNGCCIYCGESYREFCFCSFTTKGKKSLIHPQKLYE